MNAKVIEYLHEQQLASVCCVDSGGFPLCFNCYYAYDEPNQRLYFKSAAQSNHAQIISYSKRVAGTILPGKVSPLDTRGIQFTAVVLEKESYSAFRAGRLYYQKYPFALAIPGDIYALALTSVKLTQSQNGLQKKWLWKKPEHEVANTESDL